MAGLFGGVEGGLLDSNARSGVLSDDGIERMLRPPRAPTLEEALDPERRGEFIDSRPQISNITPSLQDEQAAFISEMTGDNRESFRNAKTGVELVETLFPPLALANLAHNAGQKKAQSLLNDNSVLDGTFADGLLAMALIPGGAPAKKAFMEARTIHKKMVEAVDTAVEGVAFRQPGGVFSNPGVRDSMLDDIRENATKRLVENNTIKEAIRDVTEDATQPIMKNFASIEATKVLREMSDVGVTDISRILGPDTSVRSKFKKSLDTFKQGDREGFMAVVDPLDGQVVHTTSYEKAKAQDFHHSMFLPSNMAMDVDNEFLKLVWFDAKLNKFRDLTGNLPSKLDKRVKEQLDIIPSKKDADAASAVLTQEAKNVNEFIGKPESADVIDLSLKKAEPRDAEMFSVTALEQKLKHEGFFSEETTTARFKKAAEETSEELKNRGITVDTGNKGPTPFRAFHGTGKQFDEFIDRPTFFALDKKEAAGYAKERSLSTGDRRVIEAELDFKNPASMDDVEKTVKKLGMKIDEFLSGADAAANDKVVANLKDQGFDGAVGLWDFGFLSDFKEIPVALAFGRSNIKQLKKP